MSTASTCIFFCCVPLCWTRLRADGGHFCVIFIMKIKEPYQTYLGQSVAVLIKIKLKFRFTAACHAQCDSADDAMRRSCEWMCAVKLGKISYV